MPPRSSPPPSGKPRRRPAPVMPGSWIWLVLFGILFLLILVSMYSGPQQVDYSEFTKLLNKDENAAYLKKITFQGSRHVAVELDYDRKVPGREDRPKDIEGLKHTLHNNNRFS